MSASGVPNGEPVACPEDSQIGTLIMHSPGSARKRTAEGPRLHRQAGRKPVRIACSRLPGARKRRTGTARQARGQDRTGLRPARSRRRSTTLPQFPVSDFEPKFKSGARGRWSDPSTCGQATITADTTPGRTRARAHRRPTPIDHPEAGRLAVCEKPRGNGRSTAAVGEHARTWRALLAVPLRLQERRGTGDLQAGNHVAAGAAGKLAGVGECPEAVIAQAQSREGVPGDGALELADPSCPAASQVGTSSWASAPAPP